VVGPISGWAPGMGTGRLCRLGGRELARILWTQLGPHVVARARRAHLAPGRRTLAGQENGALATVGRGSAGPLGPIRGRMSLYSASPVSYVADRWDSRTSERIPGLGARLCRPR
jgi:hypothetical protein